MSENETVTITRVSIAKAARLRCISRQAIWDTIQAGRINAVMVKGSEEWSRGDWYVYLDAKWDDWKPRPNKRRT